MSALRIRSLLLACVAVACDANPPQTSGNVTGPATARTEVAAASPASPVSEPKVQFELGELGQTIAEEKCKGTGVVKREPAEDSYDPKKPDEIEIVTCPGAEIGTYIAHHYSPPAEITLSLILRTPDPRIPNTHTIGARVEDVIRALGPPSRREGANLEYQTNIEGLENNHVTFVIEGGVVKEIVWAWFFA